MSEAPGFPAGPMRAVALLLALVCAPLAAGIVSVNAPGPAYGAWLPEQLDADHDTGDAVAVVGPDGVPHVMLGKYGGLYWATPAPGLAWSEELAIPGGEAPALAVSQNAVGVAYLMDISGRANLRYAELGPTGWTTAALPVQTSVMWEIPSLAFDTEGYPHITAMQATFDTPYGHPLLHVWRDATGWHNEIVAHSATFGASITFDRTNVPHIAFLKHTSNCGDCDYKPTIASRSSQGTWSTETMDAQGRRAPAIAYDSTMTPHILVQEQDLNLHHIWTSNGVWFEEIADEGPNVGTAVAMAIGSDDRIQAVAQYNAAPFANPGLLTGNIHYLSRGNDGAWTVDIVDPLGWTISPTLALDSQNNPHVAYVHLDDVTIPERGPSVGAYAIPLVHAPDEKNLVP